MRTLHYMHVAHKLPHIPHKHHTLSHTQFISSLAHTHTHTRTHTHMHKLKHTHTYTHAHKPHTPAERGGPSCLQTTDSPAGGLYTA